MPNKNALGGRGKKAPYKTEHYRIPAPIKPLVQALANQYRELVTATDPTDLTFSNLVDRIKTQAQELDQAKLIPTYEFYQLLYSAWFTEAEAKVGRDCFGYPISIACLVTKTGIPQKEFLANLAQVESELLELIPIKKKNYKLADKRVGALTFHTPMSVRPDRISSIL